MRSDAPSAMPDERGYFGEYGGRFVPETLIPALEELEARLERGDGGRALSGGTGAFADGLHRAAHAAELSRRA